MAIKDIFKNKQKDKNKGTLHTNEQGVSGDEISGGKYDVEDIAKFDQDRSYDTFNQMRKKDEKIKTLLKLVKNPIRTANWFVEPVDDSDEEVKIAELLNYIIFKNIGSNTKYKNWDEFLIEALTCIEFGFSVFEVVDKLVLEDPIYGSYIGLKDLGFRKQNSIEEWNLNDDGSIKDVRQTVDNGDLSTDTHIDGKYLLVYSLNKEGDNYIGESELRSLYRNYFIKDNLRKYQSVAFERGATGVPIAEIPVGQENSSQFKKLKDVLKRFTAHSSNYITHPTGWKIENFKLSNDCDKMEATISRLDEGMTKIFLASFIDLGTGGNGGAYALATDLSDLFLSQIEVYAKMIAEIFNRTVVRRLVDLNFGKRKEYPQLKFSGINDKKGKEFAEILKTLKDAGLLKVSDLTKDYISRVYDLPEVSEEDDETTNEETGNKETDNKETDNKKSDNKPNKNNKTKENKKEVEEENIEE